MLINSCYTTTTLNPSFSLHMKTKGSKRKEKTIRELRQEDESTTTNDKQNPDQIEAYFRDLYTSVKTFSQDEYDELYSTYKSRNFQMKIEIGVEGPLSYEECKNVLESFQNDKSPGEDEFTVEFYKLFYDLLSENLLACLNDAYEKNEFTISQRRALLLYYQRKTAPC